MLFRAMANPRRPLPRRHRLKWAGGAAFLLLAAAPMPLGAAMPKATGPKPCDRTCLNGFVDHFLTVLVSHDPSKLALSPAVRSTVNGTLEAPGGPIWQAIDAISFHQYVPDPLTGQVAFYGVAEEKGRRGTLYLRLKVEGGKLAEIEMVLGNRTVDGVPGLISPNPLFNYVLPLDQRRSRDTLTAIADSYFEGLERHDGSKVPVRPDCRRFEDGVQTSLNPMFINLPCNNFSPFTYMDRLSSRSYPIVDVERGLVVGQVVIEVSTPKGPGATTSRPPVNPLSGMVMPPNPLRSQPRNTVIRELFKIIDGQITEIQVVRLDRPYGSGDGWHTGMTTPGSGQ